MCPFFIHWHTAHCFNYHALNPTHFEQVVSMKLLVTHRYRPARNTNNGVRIRKQCDVWGLGHEVVGDPITPGQHATPTTA